MSTLGAGEPRTQEASLRHGASRSGSVRAEPSPAPNVLTSYMDCRAIMAETGFKRAAAEAIMRHLPKVQIPGVRKVYVKRRDVERYLREHERAA